VNASAAPVPELSASRKWMITFSVMLIVVMQILDTSITNVALPHMQGSLSTSVEETSWVITSYLAANAIVIPATGWIMAKVVSRCPSKDGGSAATAKVNSPPGCVFSGTAARPTDGAQACTPRADTTASTATPRIRHPAFSPELPLVMSPPLASCPSLRQAK